MADKAEENVNQAESSGGKSNKLLLILTAVNIAVILGIGMMVYLGRKAEEQKPGMDQLIEGEAATQESEAQEADEFIGQLIPMETFLINLSGAGGSRIAKINIELEVNNGDVQVEIDKRKPQIRDRIIMVLSSKSYNEVANKDGKDSLRDEIKDTLNSFLSKGEIKRVYFTDFLFQ